MKGSAKLIEMEIKKIAHPPGTCRMIMNLKMSKSNRPTLDQEPPSLGRTLAIRPSSVRQSHGPTFIRPTSDVTHVAQNRLTSKKTRNRDFFGA